MSKLLPSNTPDLWFEDTAVGRMKKEVWDASDAQIDAWLKEYGIPSPCEWAKPGSYIQTTVRHQLEVQRRKNDIVLIPVGCTELHGQHTVSAMDTFFVSHICEGVRRYTAKSGAPVNLALPPLNYGAHPYHHLGMPGTVIIREEIAARVPDRCHARSVERRFPQADHRQQPRPVVDAGVRAAAVHEALSAARHLPGH